MKTAIIAAALALATLVPVTEAQARDAASVSVEVPYGDLDLSKPSDAAIMLNRIKAAAARACGWRPDIRDRNETQFYTRCLREAVDMAVARLNAPLVTALHTGRPVTDPRFARGPKPH